MQSRPFPALAGTVSRLGYGSWPLSGIFGSVEETQARASVFAYLEGGGNFIDTARAYGQAEFILSRILAHWDGPPPTIATKIDALGPMQQWGRPVDVSVAFPRGSVRDSVEASMTALGLDVLDLVQFHIYWPTWGTHGYWLDEAHELRDRGLVKAIGISIPDYRHDSALPLVMSGAIDSVQTIINLFDPLALDTLVPIAAEHGVAVIARGVLDEGGLTDEPMSARHYPDGDMRKHYFGETTPEEYDRRTQRLRAYLPRYATDLAALALRTVLAAPGVTTVIPSMASEQLVRANLAAEDQDDVPPAVVQELITRHRWTRNFFDHTYWD